MWRFSWYLNLWPKKGKIFVMLFSERFCLAIYWIGFANMYDGAWTRFFKEYKPDTKEELSVDRLNIPYVFKWYISIDQIMTWAFTYVREKNFDLASHSYGITITFKHMIILLDWCNIVLDFFTLFNVFAHCIWSQHQTTTATNKRNQNIGHTGKNRFLLHRNNNKK